MCGAQPGLEPHADCLKVPTPMLKEWIIRAGPLSVKRLKACPVALQHAVASSVYDAAELYPAYMI